MSASGWDSLDRDSLVVAIKALDADYADLSASYEIALEHNSNLENELYSRNAALQLGMIATESELKAIREANERVMHHLIISEKLAKLGELVSVVTHELNNPMGVAMTAASFEKSCAEKIRKALDSFPDCQARELRGAILRDLEGLLESNELLVSNLRRSNELLGAFKQMAVDQASDRRREFELGEIVRQTIASLKPQLRGGAYTVDLQCPQPVYMNSYPGTIAQIFTNLVMNSLKHGFQGRDSGTIRINVACPPEGDGQAVVRYADDGVGIPPDILPRIFDQFFTTKADSGGSGLGLSIVRNLVEARLGGSISCSSVQSADGGGGSTEFLLRLPLQVG